MLPAEIAKALGVEVRGRQDIRVDDPVELTAAGKGSITWVKKFDAGSEEYLRRISGALIVHPVPSTADERRLLSNLSAHNATLESPHPRLTFAELLAKFFSHLELSVPSGIDPAAKIDPSARIGKGVTIGAFCYVGPEAEIGDGTVLHPSVTVHSRSLIGKNCIINSQTVIGTRGFGFVETAQGRWVHFPQIGRVVIEDDVEIQAGCTVCRPGLGTTVIGRGTKIDCLCHIGHNAQIGADCVVTACSEIGAGVRVGDGAWLGPNSCSIEGVVIGKKATVGIGSVIVRDVAADTVVAGSPAEPIELVKLRRAAIKKLID